MASPLPNDIFGTAFQRFAYNIDLIEKRYANKRPSGLELDVDTGKIIQVVDAKRPRLTAEEAKEKMRTTFLAPQSLLGNSSLCSPFVNDMNVSRETKLRILKHNKRFKQQLENGFDCSTLLTDENVNNNAEDDEKNCEEEEIFDMDDILADIDVEEEDDDDEEEEDVENELSEDEEEKEDIEPSDKQELEAELDNEKENEEDLSFEEPEEESTKEENTYKDLKITRALIQRLTPKVSRKPKKAAASTTKSSKKKTLLAEETPKQSRGRRSIVASKIQAEDVECTTPKVPKKISKASSAKSKTPTVSKKITKAAIEKPKKDTALKNPRGRSRKSMPVVETTPLNKTLCSRSASTGKKITKAASREPTFFFSANTSSNKTRGPRPRTNASGGAASVSKEIISSTVSKDKKITKASTSLTDEIPKNSRNRSRKSMPLIKDTPTNNKIAPSRSASTGKKITKAEIEKAKKTSKTEDTPKLSSRGRSLIPTKKFKF